MSDPLAAYCTTEAAAAILGVNVSRVRQFCRQGRLQFTRIGRGTTGSSYLILRSSVEQFAATATRRRAEGRMPGWQPGRQRQGSGGIPVDVGERPE